jgi:ABC-type microcin C transport system permease subunit YejE
MPHVICVRPIHEDAIARMRAEPGVTVEVLMDISPASLAKALPNADALIVRTIRIDRPFLAHCTKLRILARHVYPNIIPPTMVQVSLNMGWAILNAAGLSFIGLGVRPPTPEWRIMVAEGAAYIVSGEWWIAFFPGAVLMLAVFAFNMLGDALRDIFDPRRRT